MADFWLLQPAELKLLFFPHTKRTKYYLSLAPEMGLSKDVENQSYILFWVNERDKSIEFPPSHLVVKDAGECLLHSSGPRSSFQGIPARTLYTRIWTNALHFGGALRDNECIFRHNERDHMPICGGEITMVVIPIFLAPAAPPKWFDIYQ